MNADDLPPDRRRVRAPDVPAARTKAARAAGSRHPLPDPGSDADRRLLADALAALLRERSSAWRIAARIARARNRPSPDPGDFGLTDILRLSRQLDAGIEPGAREPGDGEDETLWSH